jgi:hypothetical protein
LAVPDFLPPSQDIHEALLLLRTKTSSSPGVGKLCDAVDAEPDDDGAWSSAAEGLV